MTCWHGKENKCKELIEQRTDAVVHIPQEITFVQLRHRKSKKLRKVSAPLYPGYLFIELNIESWQNLLRLPRIMKILKLGNLPYYIRKEQLDDVVIIENAEELFFGVGDSVLVTSGPFVNLTGIISADNFKVEIELFNRKILTRLPMSILKKI